MPMFGLIITLYFMFVFWKQIISGNRVYLVVSLVINFPLIFVITTKALEGLFL